MTAAEGSPRYPSVTAVVASRDRPESLERAVRAILGQTYPGHLECLVVFDQQEAAEVAVPVPPNRALRILTNTRTPGLAGARNSGAFAAAGDLLAFCDDDDEWLPQKIELQAEALSANTGTVVATCGILVCTRGRVFRRVPEHRFVHRDDLLRSRNTSVHSSTLLVRRRSFLDEIGGVDEQIPGSYGEDYEWTLRAAAVSPIVVVPEPLVRIFWTTSWYADRWDVMIAALEYHLAKQPELTVDSRNAARMYGRLAFACASAGRRGEAWTWARRSIGRSLAQPRGYLALLVAMGVVRPMWVIRGANAVGRGV